MPKGVRKFTPSRPPAVYVSCSNMEQRRPKSGEFLMQPGQVYQSDAPEFVGRFAVRQEIQALPGDSKSSRTLGWTLETRNGGEVYLLDEHNKPIEKPLTNRDDIREGLRIYAPTLVGAVTATVTRDEEGDLCWESTGLVGDLDFDTDGRHAWVTTVAINKKLLR